MIEISWIQLGRINFCDRGWPVFPSVDKVAGLYRLRLDDGWTYVGQAANLAHRLYEYRRPTQGVVQEHSIHRALVAAKGATVDLFLSAELKDRNVRFALEQQEIERARKLGMRLLNGGDSNETYRLELDMQYHLHQLETLRTKLASRKAEAKNA